MIGTSCDGCCSFEFALEKEIMKTVIALFLFCGIQLTAQDMQSCPMHKEHMKQDAKHQADVEKHSDESMGFSHDKTVHHFFAYSDGGAIEVTVNDSKDSEDLLAVRTHLRQNCHDVRKRQLFHVRGQPNSAWSYGGEGHTQCDFVQF
jgi:hypothetical protein